MDQLEANKSLVEKYVELFNQGDQEALRSLFTEDAVVYGVLGWGDMNTVMPVWRELHEAFGLTLKIEAMVAEGDQVAVRYTERGIFAKAFRGQEPTGKAFELVAMEYFVLRDGKISRRWGARDAASQARQIGMKLT